MKTFAALCLCLLAVIPFRSSAQSPIVFDSSAHRVHANTVGVYSFSLPSYSFNGAADFRLDISKLISIASDDQPTFYNSFLEGNDSRLPNSIYYPNSFNYITPTQGYYADSYMKQSATGFHEYALNKTSDDRASLADMTGNTADSLIIPAQIIMYSSPRTIIPYPSSMSSAWKSSYRVVANARVSIAAAGLKDAELQIVNNWTFRDTIIAWGNVVVPIKGGAVSKPYPVLVSKRWSTRIDSMYLNGQPAPAVLMNGFGATNGSTTHSYRCISYRLDEPNYIFNLSYGSDASYSKNPTLSISDLVEAASPVAPELQASRSSAYPSPADQSVTLCFEKSNEAPWSIEVLSTLGSTLRTHMLSAGAGEIQLPLSLIDLPSGVYTVFVRDEHDRVAVRQSVVVRH